METQLQDVYFQDFAFRVVVIQSGKHMGRRGTFIMWSASGYALILLDNNSVCTLFTLDTIVEFCNQINPVIIPGMIHKNVESNSLKADAQPFVPIGPDFGSMVPMI